MTAEIIVSALPKPVTHVTIELIPKRSETPALYANWYGDTIHDGERTMLKLYDPVATDRNDYITVCIEDIADCKVVDMA